MHACMSACTHACMAWVLGQHSHPTTTDSIHARPDCTMDRWKATCDEFGMQLTPHTLVELAGTPPKALFEILAERSGRSGMVDPAEASLLSTHEAQRVITLVEAATCSSGSETAMGQQWDSNDVWPNLHP